MIVNIFGVGRSGTKAITLYLSYLLAEDSEKIWLNYEPYYWKNRKLRDLNYEGIFYHQSSPLFTNRKYENKSHEIFLKRLVNHQKHEHIVTKFIRANGRIDFINSIMKPDLTIIIVRNLYGVLESLAFMNWDLLGTCLANRNDWPRIRSKESVFQKRFDLDISKPQDKMVKNAVYWFLMNKSALETNNSNTYYVLFEHIERIERICHYFGLENSGKTIDQTRFRGGNLHLDIPLEDFINNRREHLTDGWVDRVNRLLMKKPLKKLKVIIPYPKSKIGSSIRINNSSKLAKRKERSKTNLKIAENELFESFNKDIMNILDDNMKQI